MMKWMCLVVILLALVEEGEGAAGDVGAVCGTGDSCTDSNAYCDDTDTNNKRCQCNTGWVQKSNRCVRAVGKTCHNSQCHQNLVCITGGMCQCDTTLGYSVGTNGTTTCACPTGQVYNNGKCRKVVDQACSTAEDCVTVDGMTCADRSGSTKCTCNTNAGYGAGSAGDQTCSCDSNHALQSGSCKKKVDQQCSQVSECYTADGIVCVSSGSAMKCLCDTANGFAAASAGAISCACDTNYHLESGACKKKLEQPCTSAAVCVSGAGIVCADSSGTNKCICDTTNNFAAAVAGQTSCACATNYHLDNGACKKKLDQPCTAAAECVSGAGVVCADSSGTNKCICDTANNFAAAVAGQTSCACATNYHLDNGACKKKVGQPCTTAAECIGAEGIVCADDSGTNKCLCDTANGYAAGTAGDTSCLCNTPAYRSQSGACKKTVDQTCSSAGDCVTADGIVCADRSGSNKCTCNTNAGYGAGAAGDHTCSCDSNHLLQSGACKKKVNQDCTQATECINVDGMTCAIRTAGQTATKCTCDTNAGYATGSNGDTTCSCSSDYTAQDSQCVLRVGKPCNSSTAACVHGSLCDKATSTCKCDTANNFLAGSLGDTSCSCDTDSVGVTVDGKTECVRKIGGSCKTSTDTYACGNRMSCKTVNATTRYTCQCDSGTPQQDGECSGVEIQIMSLAVVLACFMMSMLI